MTRPGQDQTPAKPNAASAEKDTSQTASAKGKGKDTASDTSIVARLQSSSSMLSRAVLSSSTLSGASGTLAGSSVAAKAGGSRSSSSLGESAYVAYGDVNGRHGVPSHPSSGFRSTRIASDESEKFENFLDKHDQDPGFTTSQLIDRSNPGANLNQARDGSAVIELLSSLDELDEVSSIMEGDHFGDFRGADMLRQALFETPSSGHVPWDHLLNFNPSFVSTPKGDSSEAFNQLGTESVDEAREMWVNQWREVLSSYTDDVWGALEPLMVAARQEVDATADNGKDTKTGNGALQRLRMILAHVRGS